MSIPIKQSLYKYSQRWPKYIILHHTEELQLNNSNTKLETPKFQTNSLIKSFYELESNYLPYNFIIEKIGDEYQAIVSAPILTKIGFLDLDDVYQESIHIGLMGNYNMTKVDKKLYEMLSLRVIIPMMRAFKIPESNIVKHSDVSLDSENKCPGDMVDLAMLKTYVRSNMRMRSVTRG